MYVSSESPDVMTITTSWVANVMGKTITTERWTLEKARDFFMPVFPLVVTKDERDVRQLFSFNIYKSGTTRGKQNVEAMTGVVFDFDNKEDFVPIQTVLDRLNYKRVIYFFYTSYSHTKECPRWRLMIPFAQALPVSEWNAVYDQMVILIGNPPGIDHQSCRDVAHIWFPPYKNADHPFESFACREGFMIEPLDLLLLLTPEEQAEYARQQEEKKKKASQPQQSFVSLTEPSSFSLEQAKELLQYINPNCTYEQWIRVGMGLHFQFGSTTHALNLWSAWSQGSPKFPGEDNLLARWRGFSTKEEKVTIGTLIHYAQENGYVLLPVIEMQDIEISNTIECGDPDDVPETSNIPFIEEEETGSSDEIEFDFSDYEQVDIYDLPSPLLKEIYRYLFSCASYQNPLYALGASIVLGGFLMRNHVEGFSKLRTNFMALTIGFSGTGKTQILKAVQNILIETDQKKHFVSTLGTIQGCIEALRQKDNCLFLVQDEASYAAKASKNKNVTSHEQNVEKFKMDAFSMQPLYAPPAAKIADLTPVESPFFCEISSSTPDILKHFSPDDFSKGLVPRYLIFREKVRLLKRNPPSQGILPLSLLTELGRNKPLLDQNRVTGTFNEEAHPFFEKFKEKVDRYRDDLAVADDHPHQLQIDAALGRLSENAEKLSLLGGICTVATYEIPLQATQWGIGVALLSFKNLLQMIKEGVYENQTEEYRGRVLNLINKKSKGEWVTKSVVSWSTKFLKSRELTEILHKLKEEGSIEMKERGKHQIFIKPIEKGKKS